MLLVSLESAATSGPSTTSDGDDLLLGTTFCSVGEVAILLLLVLLVRRRSVPDDRLLLRDRSGLASPTTPTPAVKLSSILYNLSGTTGTTSPTPAVVATDVPCRDVPCSLWWW